MNNESEEIINHGISIVVPVYNEVRNLDELYKRLKIVLNKLSMPYEIIFVDDGSQDSSLAFLEGIYEIDRHVKIISLSRNFGHQAAITCGMDNSAGAAVLTLDADLQHPPELIPDLIDKWREGYDVVYTIRESSADINFLKKTTSRFFYKFLNVVGQIKLPENSADFRLLDKKVVDELGKLQERYRFVRGLVSWVGFRQIGIKYAPSPRFSGESKYSWKKMIGFAFDGVASFSSFPLYLASYIGLIISSVSFIYAIYVLYIRLFTKSAVSGWSSTILVTLFLGGIQLFSIGVIGAYLGRLYEEIKQRPLYIASKRLTRQNEDEIKK